MVSRRGLLAPILALAIVGLTVTALLVVNFAYEGALANVAQRVSVRSESNLRVAARLLADYGVIAADERPFHLVQNVDLAKAQQAIARTQDFVGGVVSFFLVEGPAVSAPAGFSDAQQPADLINSPDVKFSILEQKHSYHATVEVFGKSYASVLEPVFDHSGAVVAVIYVGVDRDIILLPLDSLRRTAMAFLGATLVSLIGIAIWLGERSRAQFDVQGKALKLTSEHLDVALGSMVHGLAVFDASGHLVIANECYSAMFGLAPEALFPGMSDDDFWASRLKHGVSRETGPDDVIRRRQAVLRGERIHFRERCEDGRIVEIALRPNQAGGWTVSFEDVTLRLTAENLAQHVSTHDALTGLTNRTALQDRIKMALLSEGPVSLVMLDLDRFQEINDARGHRVGDSLLCAVAGRLTAHVEGAAAIVRNGGDEFAVLIKNGEEAALEVAQVIQKCLQAAFPVDATHIDIQVSIGVATLTHGTTEDLLAQADIAMFRAKELGGGRIVVYEAGMDQRLRDHHALSVDLKHAVEEFRLELHYQPLVDVQSKRICGFEALMRWPHPNRGMVSPAEFIPIAESTGLICPLGVWALRRACHDAASWPPSVKVSVNLSPVQFRSATLVADVRAALGESGLAPHRLELEVTESTLVQDKDVVTAILVELRSLGVRISLDDFGTGYSSLSYLRFFPFDKIKIDRSFVGDLGSDRHCSAVVQAVAGLANNLGIASLAEGVETQQQFDLLRARGCNEVQGFLFSRAVPLREVGALLSRFGPMRRRL